MKAFNTNSSLLLKISLDGTAHLIFGKSLSSLAEDMVQPHQGFGQMITLSWGRLSVDRFTVASKTTHHVAFECASCCLDSKMHVKRCSVDVISVSQTEPWLHWWIPIFSVTSHYSHTVVKTNYKIINVKSYEVWI